MLWFSVFILHCDESAKSGRFELRCRVIMKKVKFSSIARIFIRATVAASSRWASQKDGTILPTQSPAIARVAERWWRLAQTCTIINLRPSGQTHESDQSAINETRCRLLAAALFVFISLAMVAYPNRECIMIERNGLSCWRYLDGLARLMAVVTFVLASFDEFVVWPDSNTFQPAR